MEWDKILVSLVSIGGIVGTYWFFLMNKDAEPVVVTSDTVDILVDGGYSPNVISIPKNRQTTLRFIRRDPSACLEEVTLPDFKIKKYLPLNQTTEVTITPKKSGTYEIACGMNMFHGKILVK